MTNIGNQISFNNRSYNVDRSNNGQNQTAVRENFAAKLNDVALSGNTITEAERAELETLSSTGTASERAIVATISRAGTAAFDPDASASMPPVQVSFGTPSPSPTTTQAPQAPTTNNQSPPAAGEFRVRVGGEYGQDATVSRSMASFLDSATRSNNDINPAEFTQLGEISARTRTPGDVQVNENLRDLAVTQTNDRQARTPILIGSDTQPRQVRLNNTPAPEGRAGAGGGVGNRVGNLAGATANQFFDRASGVLATAGINVLSNVLGVNNTDSSSTTDKPEEATTTPAPTPDVTVPKDKS